MELTSLGDKSAQFHLQIQSDIENGLSHLILHTLWWGTVEFFGFGIENTGILYGYDWTKMEFFAYSFPVKRNFKEFFRGKHISN